MFGFKKDEATGNGFGSSGLASGGLAGATSLAFVYSLDYAELDYLTMPSSKGDRAKRVQRLVPTFTKKTPATDGVAGLYRGFGLSVIGIVVYRGL